MRALHRMGPDAINLKRLLKMKLAEMDAAALNKQHGDRRRMYTPRNQKYGNTATTASETMEDLLGLVRSMIGAYDRILATSFRLEERGLGPLRKDILVESRLQKAKLAAYLGKIDKKYLVGDGKGGRTGLWEGYDPAAKGTFEKPGRTEEGEEAAEEDQASDGVDRDYFLKRTVSGARLKKAVKMEEKIIEKDREMKSGDWKRLSRRQTQEQEKERREERVRVLRSHDVKARGSRPGRAVRTETGERVSRAERVPRAETYDRPARSDQAWKRPSGRNNDSFERGGSYRNPTGTEAATTSRAEGAIVISMEREVTAALTRKEAATLSKEDRAAVGSTRKEAAALSSGEGRILASKEEAAVVQLLMAGAGRAVVTGQIDPTVSRGAEQAATEAQFEVLVLQRDTSPEPLHTTREKSDLAWYNKVGARDLKEQQSRWA